MIISNFISVLGFVGAEEELLCKLPLSVSHTYVYPLLICQCSRFLKGKAYRQKEGWRWDQEKNEGKKDALITVGGKEINAHLECANHYNLAQKSGIKGLCKILLTDLFLRVIKIMPEKQFLFLSLDLIQKLYIALEIFLLLTSFFK